jgi:hypothetical protein
LDALAGIGVEGIIRLESPGRNWQTEQALLKLGAEEPDCEDPQMSRYERFRKEEIDQWSEPAGRVIAMRQWYLGWCRALRDLALRLPKCDFFNPPEDVACLFDKAECQRRVIAAGAAMPPSLGVPESFDDLIERMKLSGRTRIFLKACHGSSASGVVALEMSRDQIQMFTTARLVGAALWNVRPGYRSRDLKEIRALVDAVCRHRAQAQVWVPKMGWRNRRLDLRVVTIAGHARHTVVRMSETPLTNLQLRNARGDLEAFAAEHGPALDAAKSEAERAASAFPQCMGLGIDVAITPDGRAWVLEANAFGDLLPGCKLDGWDTYRWEVEAMRRRYVSASGR